MYKPRKCVWTQDSASCSFCATLHRPLPVLWVQGVFLSTAASLAGCAERTGGGGGNGEAFAFLHTVNHVPTPVGEFRASWVVSSEIMLGRNKKRLLAEQRGSGIKQEGLHPRTRITKHSKQHCSHLYSQGFHKKLLSRFEVFI